MNRWKTAFKKHKILDIKNFVNWVFVKFFNDETKPWWVPILEPIEACIYLSESPKSPYSPDQLAELWALKKSLTKKLGKEQKPHQTKEVSEVRLNEITKTLNLPPRVANALCKQGLRKLKTLLDLDLNVSEAAIEKIAISRTEVAKEMAEISKQANGDTTVFLDRLKKTKLLSKKDLQFGDYTAELRIWAEMSQNLSQEEIVNFLLEDIAEDDNFFKLFQNCAAKRLFPRKKSQKSKLFKSVR